MKILIFGEIIWDVYESTRLIGGAPLNVCVHCSRLSLTPYFLSAVGEDLLGDKVLSYLQGENINTNYISKNNFATGKCDITLDKNSTPTYNILKNMAYDHIDISSDIFLEKYDAFYFGTLAQRSVHNQNSLKKILKKGAFREIFCDINLREPFYMSEIIKKSFGYSSIVKVSREELPQVSFALFGKVYLNIRDFSYNVKSNFPKIKIIIITLDKDGAYAFDCQTEREYTHNAIKTEPLSTVGAGDSFSAAFLSTYLKEPNIELCLDNAIKLSSFVVSKMDAVPKYRPEDIFSHLL